MRSFFLVAVLVGLGACDGKPAAEPSPPPSPPAATADTSNEATPDCGPENSLGGMCMSSGGKSLWPPTGPGCERLVACCRAMSGDLKPAAGCLLASIAYPGDCPEMLKSATAMAREKGGDLPAVCAAVD